jgi:hypothetical protein
MNFEQIHQMWFFLC